MGRFLVLAKKTFSLSLIFNALLTIACASGIIAGFYWFFPDWKPFYPYLVDGNVFWMVIVAGVMNIFPSARIGRSSKIGRFLFHHYFYGFLVLLTSAFYVVVFTPTSLLTIFLVDNTSVVVNVGRFFLLGGFTLVLDDLPDVSKRVESALNWLKTKAHQGGKILSTIQLLTGTASLYLFIAVGFAVSQTSQWVTLANFILMATILITSITSFVFAKRRIWLNIAANKQGSVQTHH